MSVHAQSLDEQYFDWLCEKVGRYDPENPDTSYFQVAELLFKTPFDDSVPNDFNRGLDGKDLRQEFLTERHLTANKEWLELDCSIFEMLAGLARRVSFHTDWEPARAFLLFLTNLGLSDYTDTRYHRHSEQRVKRVLRTLNNRTYDYNGLGGLFPLKNPLSDQRGVEIWYQMSAYLMENYEF